MLEYYRSSQRGRNARGKEGERWDGEEGKRRNNTAKEDTADFADNILS